MFEVWAKKILKFFGENQLVQEWNRSITEVLLYLEINHTSPEENTSVG